MTNIWQASYSHKDFAVIEENVEYNGHFKVLNQKIRFKMFSGAWSQVITRAQMLRQAAVVVLLYDPQADTVLLVEQFRPGAMHHPDLPSPWLLEPVAGLIELPDTVEATARREVAEEAGCLVLDLMPICQYLASPGVSNEMVYVLCGRSREYQTGSVHGLLSEAEDIKVHVFPTKEAFNLLENSKIIAASGIIALQWLQININIVRDKWQS